MGWEFKKKNSIGAGLQFKTGTDTPSAVITMVIWRKGVTYDRASPSVLHGRN